MGTAMGSVIRVAMRAAPRHGAIRCATAAGFVLAGSMIFAIPQTADARRPRRRPRPVPAIVTEVQRPLGLQGSEGAGASVVIPFRLLDDSRTPADVEVEFGVDGVNGDPDGMISPDEYRPATEDRLDPRNTRANRNPQVLTTGAERGAANAFVWRSDYDIPLQRWLWQNFHMAPTGRLTPDPDHPGSFLFGIGSPGVVVRVRAVAGTGRRRTVSDWVTSPAFELDNTSTPTMRIDSVAPGGGEARGVSIAWLARHADSEDLNGNGVFEPQLGEDVNGDGRAELRALGVHFDFHVLAPGEDPARMTAVERDRLEWSPCSRLDGAGDNDSLPRGYDLQGAEPFATPIGNSWTFVWDAASDLPPGGTERIVLRGRCVDTTLKRSEPAYWLSPVPR